MTEKITATVHTEKTKEREKKKKKEDKKCSKQKSIKNGNTVLHNCSGKTL